MADLDKLEQKAKADFEKFGKELDKEASEDKAAIQKIKQLADKLKKAKDD